MINILTSNDDLVININTSNHIQHASTNVYTLTGVESSIHDMWRYEYLYYTPVSGFWESPDRLEHELQTVRRVRDQALADTDWIVIRSTETNQPLDSNFSQYRAWLRDLPANYTPTQPVSCPVESLSAIGIEINIIDKLQPWTYISVVTAESRPRIDRQRIQHEEWLKSVPVTGWSEDYYYESVEVMKSSSITITTTGIEGDLPAIVDAEIEVYDIDTTGDETSDPEIKLLDLSTIWISPTG